jgi:hypothetical protein
VQDPTRKKKTFSTLSLRCSLSVRHKGPFKK